MNRRELEAIVAEMDASWRLAEEEGRRSAYAELVDVRRWADRIAAVLADGMEHE